MKLIRIRTSVSDAEKDCGKGEGEDKNKDCDDFNKDFWARKVERITMRFGEFT